MSTLLLLMQLSTSAISIFPFKIVFFFIRFDIALQVLQDPGCAGAGGAERAVRLLRKAGQGHEPDHRPTPVLRHGLRPLQLGQATGETIKN